MGLELQLLAWAAALTVVQALIHTVGGVLQVGMSPLVGNREGVSELTGWAGRAEFLVVAVALVLTQPVAVHLLFRAVHRTEPVPIGRDDLAADTGKDHG